MADSKEAITVNRVRIALINLILLASLGSLIRFHFYHPIEGVNITNLHHAHSHLAFLGWVFMALFILLTHQFLPKHRFFDKSYTYIFYIMQGANVGMLFTFPFTGYAPWSIAFSSIHTIGAVVFAVVFISDLKNEFVDRKIPMSLKFVFWSFVFMGISNLVPFALGPVTSMYGKSDGYYFLVNSYLHFQYNGWFTFALLGIILRFLELKGIDTNHKKIKYGLLLKLISIIPVLLITTLSPATDQVWFYIVLAVASIQLRGLVLILQFIWLHKFQWSIQSNKWVMRLMVIALGSLLLQHTLQVLGAIPSAVELLSNRQIVIAYLHLVFIGFATVLIFSKLITMGFFKLGIFLNIGLLLFILAFFITELLLVVRVHIPYSNLALLVLALFQLAGIILLFSQAKKPAILEADLMR